MALTRSLATGLTFALTATAAMAGATAPGEVMFEDMAVKASLTGQPGDPARGRAVYLDRKLGNCITCHVSADVEGEPFPGEVGPPLDGAGDRYTEAELRALIANSKVVYEGTIMPGFYTLDVGERVGEKYAGETILSAQQVEDVVAYLMTLKEE
jgi:L-cysteine S-thiosulfotransferase